MVTAVSYTHLDVYKRQMLHRYARKSLQSLSHLIMSRTINRHNTGIAQHLLGQQPVIIPAAVFLFKYFNKNQICLK